VGCRRLEALYSQFDIGIYGEPEVPPAPDTAALAAGLLATIHASFELVQSPEILENEI
jgi:hypothetical protein